MTTPTLRERKKLRTRQALAETALALFDEHGFEATPLDALLAKVEVSRRTFFRYYRSKEDVALTAVKELWRAYLEELDKTDRGTPVTDLFRDTMLATLARLDDDWYRRFRVTLRLIDASPSLTGHSLRHCAEVQADIAHRIGDPARLDLRLAIEFCVATWRCALDEWLPACARGQLPDHVRHAFATMPDALRV